MKANYIGIFGAVFAALVAVATFFVQLPIPATKGYLNFGDIIIFVGALIFGPFVGGLAGSIGSSMADVASGYMSFAPFTFVIKGTEGVIAGLISNRKSLSRDIIAVILGGAEMVAMYFLAEFFPLSLGWTALAEVPFNILQIIVGGLVGVPIVVVIRKRIPELLERANAEIL
jgi:uncharacterized membrane protein